LFLPYTTVVSLLYISHFSDLELSLELSTITVQYGYTAVLVRVPYRM
jgi:hypothetical protein